MAGWIGVDLDGTLAYYDRFVSPTHIGAPIAPMVERVKQWLQEGYEVRIFTARIVSPRDHWRIDMSVVEAIKAWCLEHIGQELEVTHHKDLNMIELWDDRAVQVEPNTGEPVTYWSTRV